MQVSVQATLRRNRKRLIKSVMVPWIVQSITWITVVILELIHANRIPTRDGRDAFIRSKPIGAPAPHFLVTLNNFQLIARSSYRRRIFQMSDLSTVDGRFCAYHGCNG
uniref:Uncharacterized protein n=1 Tax=Homalodisca liturata TaxID=320908 RepID=A0A1B6HRB6_9HEMI